jgi:signal peptide peptidase SppA
MRADLLGYTRDHLWAVERRRLAHWLTLDAVGLDAARELAAQRAAQPKAQTSGSVAIIPVYGGITHRADFFSMFFGGSAVESLRQTIRTVMADDTIASVIFEFDSPGGTVDGVPELADEILALRASNKRVVSHVNTLAASAAYWLATQADEIVVSPSGSVGSIGVFTMHEDVSVMLEREGVKVTLISAGDHKVDGNPFEPLSDDVRAQVQKDVNEMNAIFVSAVARGRGVTAAVVNSTYGQGLTFGAREAVKLGMADRVGTLDETVARLAGYQRKKKRMSADAMIDEIHEHPTRALIDALMGPAGADLAAASDMTAVVEASLAEASADMSDEEYRSTRLAIAKRRQAGTV